ncbi:MAG TPA: enoyl-CoA hydratase/isomerase family protein [Xanthobacteraceae bacterium]|jgi:enoyl-CoA hydratase/carnithine racemase|nr:enoyl-CoA hydratase/isomerase family protein [Xanthobacteraceae bacterium]
MASFEFAVKTEGAVARIDLNRPEEGNAMTRPMMVSLAPLIRRLGECTETHVIVLEGRGDYFCRGRDSRGESTDGLTPYEMRVQVMGAVLGVYDAIGAAPVPVVARVHGNAVGFGCAVASACDLALAADTARFSFPEIKHDIPPTLAMSAVIRKVPPKALAYLIYSGQEVSAQEAVQTGLASRVLPQASFAEDFDAFVHELAGRPRLNLETIKKFMTNAAELSSAMTSEYAGTLLALVRRL